MSRFVAGESFADAVRVAGDLHCAGLAATIGRFAPVATDAATARAAAAEYAAAAAALPVGARLEIDLPHLGVAFDTRLAADLLRLVAARLPAGAEIQCGAEDATLTDAVLTAVITAHQRGAAVRATVQANLRRTPVDIDELVAHRVPMRLVKGGFAETARIALPDRDAVQRRIRMLASTLAVRGVGFTLATHDVELQDWSAHLDPAPPLETLLGVAPDRAGALAAHREVRVYVPFGPIEDDGAAYVEKRLADEARVLESAA